MAIVQAPLYSAGAVGTIGLTLIYSREKGANKVKSYSVPVPPPTISQLEYRALFKQARDLWKSYEFNYYDKGAWTRWGATQGTGWTNYNAFMSCVSGILYRKIQWIKLWNAESYPIEGRGFDILVEQDPGQGPPMLLYGKEPGGFTNQIEMEPYKDNWWLGRTIQLQSDVYYRWTMVNNRIPFAFGRTGIYRRKCRFWAKPWPP